MRVISDRLIDSLVKLGLTEYEAKAYAALVLLGGADVKQIYEYWGASKPNVYESLKSLTDMGLVSVVSAKPAVYKATPYDIALKHLIEAHKRAEETARDEFKVLEKHREHFEMPDVLWTLFGEKNIENKLEEMLSGAKHTVKSLMPAEYLEALKHLSGKDVYADIVVTGGPVGPALKYGLKHARFKELKDIVLEKLPISMDGDFEEFHKIISDDVLLLLVDDREVMYLLPMTGRVRSGLTSENATIVRIASILFNTAWRKSEGP
jgi:HTH-type transcriptional regulator, sugar sensing transcriptional regulator